MQVTSTISKGDPGTKLEHGGGGGVTLGWGAKQYLN